MKGPTSFSSLKFEIKHTVTCNLTSFSLTVPHPSIYFRKLFRWSCTRKSFVKHIGYTSDGLQRKSIQKQLLTVLLISWFYYFSLRIFQKKKVFDKGQIQTKANLEQNITIKCLGLFEDLYYKTLS